ncbi:MAG: ABC transporter substrate-binding protein [Elusimicrobia bacterium]|nr:ABC transporter substrate-binding protein [Elusimicrobiota bacterium]
MFNAYALAAVSVLAALLSPARAASAERDSKKELREITFRLNFIPGPEHSYLYYGMEKGVFAKAGLKLNILSGMGSSLSAKLVGTGNEDAGLMTADYVLMGLSKELRLKSVATLFHQSIAVVSSVSSKNIRTLKDLYGKRLGVTLESTTYPQWQGICKLQGIDRSKIKEIPITPGLAGRMLAADEIDAYVGFAAAESLALRGQGIAVHEIRFADHGIDMYGMTLAVGPKLMDDRETVRNLRNAVIESLALAQADPEAAVTALRTGSATEKGFGDVERFRAFLGWVFDEKSSKLGIGYQTPQGWKTTAETIRALGQLDDVSVYKNAFWEDKPGS